MDAAPYVWDTFERNRGHRAPNFFFMVSGLWRFFIEGNFKRIFMDGTEVYVNYIANRHYGHMWPLCTMCRPIMA